MKIGRIAQALAFGAAMLAAPASAALTHSCLVKEVKSFSDRVHVRCAAGPTIEAAGFGPLTFIVYFAVPASDWSMALRFTSMASMAVGSYLDIEYNPYVSAAWFGCQDHDCRQALSFGLRD
jgi:hypothetical protein